MSAVNDPAESSLKMRAGTIDVANSHSVNELPMLDIQGAKYNGQNDLEKQRLMVGNLTKEDYRKSRIKTHREVIEESLAEE